jgi:hypothetical protein
MRSGAFVCAEWSVRRTAAQPSGGSSISSTSRAKTRRRRRSRSSYAASTTPTVSRLMNSCDRVPSRNAMAMMTAPMAAIVT